MNKEQIHTSKTIVSVGFDVVFLEDAMKKGSKVVWDNHFEECIKQGLNVEVWMKDEMQDSGRIESFSKESFKIDGGYFLRNNVLILVE
ncbi:hypothetical protein GXP70_00550 [Paenibacillus lycopersici]|uniref:Uncharacterized protein n=1 Tax=Paenibacillus lycopersici TaxID=2704462 RepID=A0A6C0FP00_9BACL|nr:hypothetical protein [Paenibacillus lycopersici]QHT58617.1 hypothetical protein GXP70_00550 [Paenibacillus lycopersici]